MSPAPVHPAVTGFETAAGRYERGRPGYPPEAVRWMIDTFGVSEASTIVDLAAGTGKLTRALVSSGAHIIAIEPIPQMLAHLVHLRLEIAALRAVAESIPLTGGSVDAVMVGNAWHWFHANSALAEIHRVLRARGRLAIIYNGRDESVPWISQMSAIVDRHRGSAPQYRSEEWRRVFENNRVFGSWTQTDFRWVQPMTHAMLRDRVASISFIARLDTSTRTTVLDEIEDVAGREFGGRDSFMMPHTTEIYWASPLK